MFNGVCVALVTPFKNNKIDYVSLNKIIDRCIDSGVKAFVALGTTGEPCSITQEEREDIISHTVKHIAHRAVVLVGAGNNNVKTAISQCQQAERLGADGVLAVTPYYNKTTQRGLVKYYERLHDCTCLPIIAYNVPSRTGLNISPITYGTLIDKGYIHGIKEANEDIHHVLQVFDIVSDRVPVYSGSDELNYIFYSLGGSGCISVTANLLPKEVVEVYDLYHNYHSSSMLAQKRLYNINRLLFSEVNPIPIKYALSEIELCHNELRPPLTKLSYKNRNRIKKELVKFETY